MRPAGISGGRAAHRMGAKRTTGWTALALSAALAAGCAGGGASPTGSAGTTGTAGSGNPGTAGSGNGSGTTGSGNSTGTGGNPNFTLQCPNAALGGPAERLLTRNELVNTLNDVFPEVKSQWTSSLPASTISAHGFDNDVNAVVGNQLAGALLDTAKAVATAVTGSTLANTLPCSTSAADRACAETFLMKVGRRLFRRPVSQAEHDRYLTFFDTSKAKSDFKTALKWMTVALIQSPNALYRSEIGTAAGSTRTLSQYEIATELAYTYTGTTPTDGLLTMAANNGLTDPVAVARTMLATDQGKQALHRFFEQYIDYASVVSLQKPKISNFDQIKSDMVQETRALITQVVLQNGGGLKELLTTNTTNPSKALAAYYATGNAYSGGFPMPSTDYASVQRPAGLGLGVLAQGSFLSTHASSDASSPTKRGLFAFYKLFCLPKLSPPDNVPPLDTTTPVADVHTTRDRYEKVHALTNGATGNCAGCHKLFDPIGFGFEHFDEGGRFRAKEGTYDINSAGSSALGGATINFTDQESLMNSLVAQPVIHQCMAAYLAAYAYGSDEACIGPSQVPALQSGDIGIAEAFIRLAGEQHFTKRDPN